MKWLVALTIFLYNVAHDLCDESVQDVFDVKPGGQKMIYKKDLNGYTCTFKYQAQGGTHEQWQVSMELIDDGRSLMCTIARPQPSYLFFENFKMALTGPGVALDQVEAINTGNTPLTESEYTVNKNKNTLSSVKGQFKNHLERVTILASLGKTEL